MMEATSIEEGRVPLAAQQAEPLALAILVARRQRVAAGILVLADLVLAPLLVLPAFSFSIKRWGHDQVANWSLEGSVADWFVMNELRDLIMAAFLVWGKVRHQEEAAARRMRRTAVVVMLLGIWRAVMLDWQGSRSTEVFLPTVASAALAGPILSALADFMLRTTRRIEKLRPAESSQDPEIPESPDSSQYTSALTFFQTLAVLKPYFWPSTGEWKTVLMNRTRSVLTWVFVAGSKVFNLIAPVFLARATNGVSKALKEGGPPHFLTSEVVVALVMYALLIFLSKAFKELQSLIYIKVQQAAYIEIADTTFTHLHSLSLDWHLRKKMGNVVKSMDRGIQAAQQTMQYVCLYLFPTLVEAVVTTLIFVFHFQNLRLAVFIFLNLYLYVYLTVKVTLWRKRFRTGATKHDNDLHDRLTDSLINYETVKYFTAEPYERREYRTLVEKYQKLSMATQASLSMLNVLQQLVVNMSLGGGMIIATARVLEVQGSLGDFVAVNAYIINVFTPLSFLGTIYNMVVNALVDMHSFGQLLAETVEVQDQPGALALDVSQKPGVPMVEFRDVSFHYTKQPLGRSIKDVCFQVPRGKTMALVGPTGAGKTTVTRLLFRFYDTTAGQVVVNGQDVKTITQRSLRGAIGMVPQDVVMFNSTIAHNIRYGRIDGATQAEMEAAAKSAQLDGFIHEQAKGYETMVGERGLKLSGGEKQRLAIARCLVKDPPIVVLDEATSALDSQTEERIQQALQVLSSSRTVIAIAHRLSTIRHFDEINVLDSGQVVEQGTHDSLLASSTSRYAGMWQRQAAGITDDGPPASPGGGASSSEEPAAGLGMGGAATGKENGGGGHHAHGGHGHGHHG